MIKSKSRQDQQQYLSFPTPWWLATKFHRAHCDGGHRSHSSKHQHALWYFLASSFQKTCMVWHEANCLSMCSFWEVINPFPSYDILKPQQYVLHIFNIELTLWTSQKVQLTPVITFDQPLFWKAMLIVQCESTGNDIKEVVGGCHVGVSFLGCVGHLMAETGLAQVLKVVYAENAVKHILSGEAISRAIRGHLFVHAAIIITMWQPMLTIWHFQIMESVQ